MAEEKGWPPGCSEEQAIPPFMDLVDDTGASRRDYLHLDQGHEAVAQSMKKIADSTATRPFSAKFTLDFDNAVKVSEALQR